MKLNLKRKVTLIMTLASVIPAVVIGLYSFEVGKSLLEEAAFRSLEIAQKTKSAAVKDYFDGIGKQVQTFSENRMIVEAMESFRSAFGEFSNQNGFTDANYENYRSELASFYSNQFGERYRNLNGGQSAEATTRLNQLGPNKLALQYHYIQANSHPLGDKHKLDAASDSSTYSELHSKYHPVVRSYLEKFGYYDIFLVDFDSGDIVYSVFKELDFATSLLSGPYANTNFARAFKKAKNLSPNEFILVDYENYYPSYEAPASFIASPVVSNGKKIGVAIFQMPIDRLNAIMSGSKGMGESIDMFLVGPDDLMRSSSYRNKKFTVENSFRSGLEGKYRMPAIKKALAGESASIFATDMSGQEVALAYSPVSILGQLNWAFIGKIDKQEALQAVNKLGYDILIISVFLGLLSLGVGFWFGHSLAGPILGISGTLNSAMENLDNISTEVENSSRTLADSATQQASSIEQTVSSMEEMGAMLSQTTKNSESCLDLARNGQNEANSGREVINKMLSSMDEIQESNSRLEQIVHAIEQIRDRTKVINDIVSETRLLSFNASIEAARAGVHGKGFAVVAEEVGNLASMSGRAADEISDLLESSTREVVDVVASTKEKVNQGRQISEECEQVFTATSKSLESILEATESITSAAGEQELGVKQTNNAMVELERITQQNATSSKYMSSQADALNHETAAMVGVLKHLNQIVASGSASGVNAAAVGAPIVQASVPVDEPQVGEAVETGLAEPQFSRSDKRWSA